MKTIVQYGGYYSCSLAKFPLKQPVRHLKIFKKLKIKCVTILMQFPRYLIMIFALYFNFMILTLVKLYTVLFLIIIIDLRFASLSY